MNTSILKPANDICEYDAFTLSNGLQVFTVNDPSATMAFCAMNIKVGHMSDTLLGIAHFLEHMLFNGTKKYPNEKQFMSFIAENSGHSNAYTAHDHTCYYYSINSNNLSKSLDMFGHFFVDPCIDKPCDPEKHGGKSCIDRELKAVNSEHMKNIKSDQWRYMEILRNAYIDTHPLKKFGTGTSETLGVPNIGEKVREFYETYYSSHIMTLFVLSNNIQNVKKEIEDLFSQIQRKIIPLDTNPITGQILKRNITINMVPEEDKHVMNLYWDINSFHTTPKLSPHKFLCCILGHEGINTIYNALDSKEYITHLIAGLPNYVNDRCIFLISMELTDKGNDHRDEILKCVLDYIEMMKNKLNDDHVKKIYDEFDLLNQFKKKYSLKLDGEHKILEYCDMINKFVVDMHELPIISYLSESFDKVKDNIKIVLNQMTLENVVIVNGSKKYSGNTNLVDKYYGTQYSMIEKIECASVSDPTIHFDFPPLNKYISIGDKLLEQEGKIICNSQDVNPIKIFNKKYKLFWHPITKFKTPDCYIITKIQLPLSLLNSYNCLMLLLYIDCIQDAINSEKYLCEMSMYVISIYVNVDCVYIKLYGNYEKINIVNDFIIKSIMNSDIITQKNFNKVKTLIKNNDMNVIHDMPYKRLQQIFYEKMSKKYYSYKDRLQIIDNINVTKENMIKTVKEIMSMMEITISASGNITKESAIEIANSVSLLNKGDLNNVVPMDLLSVVHQDVEYIVENENREEANSATCLNVFVDVLNVEEDTIKSVKNICLLNLLDNIMSVEYFNTLRTQEEFGYIVKALQYNYGKPEYSHRYYGFLVQSPHKTTEEIIKRTKEFIVSFEKNINDMSDKTFDDIRQSAITLLMSPSNNIIEEADLIFNNEIATGYCNINNFSYKKDKKEQYEKLTKEELKNFYTNCFLKNKRFIIVGVEGHKNK